MAPGRSNGLLLQGNSWCKTCKQCHNVGACRSCPNSFTYFDEKNLLILRRRENVCPPIINTKLRTRVSNKLFVCILLTMSHKPWCLTPALIALFAMALLLLTFRILGLCSSVTWESSSWKTIFYFWAIKASESSSSSLRSACYEPLNFELENEPSVYSDNFYATDLRF